MNITRQSAKAEAFRKLHAEPFVLPNAWDAMSAKIFQSCGFKAIGTTSAGIAFSNGYEDRNIPFEMTIAAIKQMTETVDLPISADIEDGYGQSVEEVLASVREVIVAGAVGINLEDSTMNPEAPLYDILLQQQKITAIKELAASMGIPLFINARTDVYWMNVGQPESQLPEAIKRAQAYEEAGADCIFIPGMNHLDTIRTLRQSIACPINLLAGPQLPALPLLSDIGIHRVSCGSGPYRAVTTLLKEIGDEILSSGTFEHMTNGVLSYHDVSHYLSKKTEEA